MSRILVVEDDRAILKGVTDVLRKEGFDLVSASDGREGLQRALHEDVDLAIIKSPIVGTFYRASEPDAKPFTDVGQMVKTGQVLCIIEAMKLMNEINAECDGEVVKVYVENGRAVHYGERLFAIRPT